MKNAFPFLKEVKAECLQNTITNLNYAFNNFYKSGKGFPKFKSKRNSKDSFTQNQSFVINGKVLTFLKKKIRT